MSDLIQNKCSGPAIDLSALISVNNTIAANTSKGADGTRSVALTAGFVPLTAEACKSVTLINGTSAVVNFISNGGSSAVLPISGGITLVVSNTSLVSVKGTGELSFIVNN